MEDRRRVAAIAWFAGLDEPIRTDLIARGRLLRRAAGEWLYGEGDEETGLVAVLDGGLHMYAQARGGRQVLFGMLPPGTVMGQSAVLGGGPRLVTAIAAADSLLFLLSDRALREATAVHPSLWRDLSTLVYAQLRGALAGLTEAVALKPRERMISRLLAMSTDGAPIPVSQAVLAEMIGASRKAVNGWLGELERNGMVSVGYGRIEVRDRAGLERGLG